MKLIAADQICIAPNRQRQEFDLAEINQLGESIAKYGLFHPVVLRSEEGVYTLVAGERRLRAMKDLHELNTPFKHDFRDVPAGQIPYVDLGELDELAREEAEWEENYNRADLTWQEAATATARLSALRARQFAAGDAAAPPTLASLAEELQKPSETVPNPPRISQELAVARHLHDPEIAGAKDLTTAFKTLKRKAASEQRVKLALEVGKTYSADSAHSLHNTDALLWLADYRGPEFDVICTDPPYGIDADQFGDSGGIAAGAHFYKDSYDNWKKISTTLAKEGFRITKPQAHLYCFCDIDRFGETKAILEEAGWDVFRSPLVWHKPNGARTPWVDGGPQRQYELICYARKGKKLVTRIYGDVLTYATDKNMGHPAQKPVALIEDLLRRSCQAGDSVLDPFGGSGAILVGANSLKLKATVIELDPAAYGICLQRLKALSAEPELEGPI